MSRARFGLKAFGLCLLAALGLTAFIASGAQASWLVLGAAITADQEVEVLQHEKHGILLVPSKGIEILCKKISATNTKEVKSVLKVTPLASALAVLNFSECTTFQPAGVEQKKCVPKEPIEAKGKGGLILHEKLHYILLEPEETNFARVDFPTECALPDTNISGSLVLECLGEDLKTMAETGIDYCLNEELKHLLRQVSVATQEKLFPNDKLLYGVNASNLDGIAAVELKNSDCKWSGHV